MNARMLAALAVVAAAFAVAPVSAQDAMPASSGPAMSLDAMKQGAMHKDGMMKKDAMKHGAMKKHNAMRHDDRMKKDDAMKMKDSMDMKKDGNGG
jgi:pentapeptide MXKDX repeat protein